jgi:hypothetical protein
MQRRKDGLKIKWQDNQDKQDYKILSILPILFYFFIEDICGRSEFSTQKTFFAPLHLCV